MTDEQDIIMEGVREYSWEEPVCLRKQDDNGRTIIYADDGGTLFLEIDLEDILKWLAENWPELMIAAIQDNTTDLDRMMMGVAVYEGLDEEEKIA